MEANSTAQAMHTVAEVQHVYKTNVKPSMRPKVNSSRLAYQALLESWDEDRIEFVEQFKVLLVTTANRILGVCEICTGGVAATYVDIKLIMTAALKANATGVILAHNHPSGNLQPSNADKEITKKIVMAGQILEIRILDHIIVTTDGYFSFQDEGLL
ncbi:JAB domain-containing protein [Sphingobacterium sp. JB170]|uniref:JAB domain-containing protein n=1 Tax=Sphingobacterium sp. JB170 TaxID=1434842 RepID=UPI00097EEF0D|nr:JAB domain-containing protein [Sphingobacterium sp. JB170]SJN22557.1 DNA repair protein RadC [Sphingobacterium sp. JB170]